MDEESPSRRVRLVAVGDELLTPAADPRALGWFGRVLSKTPLEGLQLEPYVLAVPGEGVEALSKRWEAEAASRFGPIAGSEAAERYLLVALNDKDLRDASSARARLNLANILDRASQQGIRCFVVGPVPGLDPDHNRRVAELNRAYMDVAERRGHTYVDAFTPLADHAQWRTDLTANEGRPGQAAFGLIAWLVLHRGWYAWLGINE
ncbi:GDSL-type esterase/lipase family protein [Nesterenkonia sphaerica]|uniref:Lysophospholipase n=1 Tax=Nesterenkonia sphaerica TaxID=1804988 RepID=A0A5R9AF28_9MICC|nr:GDSL-type esterase/lipase family protein [Nesterenkonia sphaerica]TLP77382.1 lysophospholipase [Nesterenkonia sphaerica]